MSTLMKMSSDLDMSMSAVWRVLDYEKNLPQEKNLESPKAPADWPSSGAIEARRIAYRYREGLPKVIHDISFSFKSHEKIGVVGRTGSGKSTLTLALLRILEIAREPLAFVSRDGNFLNI
jgi:ABC-type multidrug transport system fused ATPase/permease subunit